METILVDIVVLAKLQTQEHGIGRTVKGQNGQPAVLSFEVSDPAEIFQPKFIELMNAKRKEAEHQLSQSPETAPQAPAPVEVVKGRRPKPNGRVGA